MDAECISNLDNGRMGYIVEGYAKYMVDDRKKRRRNTNECAYSPVKTKELYFDSL